MTDQTPDPVDIALDRLTAENTNLREQLDRANTERQTLAAEVSSANQQIATIKTHYTRRVDTLTARAERAEAELATLKRHASHLFDGVDAAYNFANKLDADCCGTYAQQLRDAIGKAGTAPVPGSSRRAQEAGDRVEDGGMMGTLVRCEMCGGSGLLHQPDELPETAAPAPETSDPEPTDDEIAEEIDRAQEAAEAEAQAHAQGYAEAVARLRDDDRYRNWWTARAGAPGSYPVYWDGPGRHHLADYLETVGPGGEVGVPDPGRWPAREQSVVRAAIAWRRMRLGKPTKPNPESAALIEAVDALPHAGESQASEPGDWRQAYELKVQDLARETARLSKLVAAVEADGHRGREDCRTAYCGICRALREVTGEPAAPKLAQGGRRNGCGPACSEGHTFRAGCAIKPPARAFLGEKPCGKPGCPCGSTQ